MRRAIALAAFSLLLLSAQTVRAQEPSDSSSFGTVTLSEGFYPDPLTIELTAGGAVQVDRTETCSYGIVSDLPDVILDYSKGSPATKFYIYVNSEEDTTLLVHMNGNWRCGDDEDGINPVVEYSGSEAGKYHIWVGTYGTDYVSAVLLISEVDPR